MTSAVLVVLAVALAPAAVSAQGWTADLYAGGTRPQGLAAQVTSTNLVANVRGPWRWWPGPAATYLSVGAPLGDGASFWGAAGLAARSESLLWKSVSGGIESSIDAFAFRERAIGRSGGAVAGHFVPFLSVPVPTGGGVSSALELRAGLHRVGPEKHVTGAPRELWEAAGRASATAADLAVVADVRWLHGDSAGYRFAGVQALRARGPVRGWAAAGRWLAPLDQTAWELGAALPAGRWGELWASVRQDATDPLWGSGARRSWNVGFSRALGRGPDEPPGPEVEAGRVRIRLDGGARAVRIAGEFNRWMPAPMRRSGDEWVLELPLASGVYRFAFVDEAGDWFVPEGYPGRIDDGMGGHVAVLVVP